MKVVKASLCVLLIAPMVSFAEDSTTRPAAPPPQQSVLGPLSRF